MYIKGFFLKNIAERVGFEPTVPLLVHELSKLARSATLTPLQFIGPYYFIIQFGHSPKESFGLTPLQYLHFHFRRDAKVSKFCKHCRL